MAPPPRKTGSVSRGTGGASNDPERANATVARASNPLEDPERANKTVAKAQNPIPSDKTEARAPMPKRRPKRAESSTEVGEAGDDGSYHTGQSYQYDDDSGEAMAGSLDLEGDGLEALEPDAVPRTRAMPAHQADDGGGDEDEEEDDANATQAGPPIKLEIVKGPDSGRKRKFKGVRMVIGRTPGVDLQLSDQSVSRRHIEIVRSDDGVMMRDLGSGNGTRVNGEKTAEKVLEHGDEIAIGKTVIRYVDELAAFKKARDEAEKKESAAKAKAEQGGDEEPETEAGEEGGEEEEAAGEEEEGGEAGAEGEEEAPKRRRTGTGTRERVRPRGRPQPQQGGPLALWNGLNPKAKLAAAGGVGLMLLLLVIFLATRPPPVPPVDPNLVAAEAKMAAARNAVRQEQYEETVKLIEEAEGLFPGIDATHLGDNARLELAAGRGIAEAQSLMAQGRFDAAREVLAKVPTKAVKGSEAAKKVLTELEAQEVTAKKAKVEELLAAGEIEEAKTLVQELPPGEAGELSSRVLEFEAELAAQLASDEQQSKANAAAAARAAKARREEQMGLAFAVVERKFSGGEWDRAASECDRVIDQNSGDREIAQRARELKRLIPNFGRNFDEGKKKFRQKALTVAARPLRNAYKTYKQMQLYGNPYGRELEEMLAQSSVVAGKEALLRNDIASAAMYFKEATKLDPNDTQARDGLEKTIGKAEDLYQEAYMIRDRDPREALRKFKIVVEVTPAGSATHEKAKNQVAAMQP